MRPRVRQAVTPANDFRRRRLALDLGQAVLAALIDRSQMTVSKIERHELRGGPAAQALAVALAELEAEQEQ